MTKFQQFILKSLEESNVFSWLQDEILAELANYRGEDLDFDWPPENFRLKKIDKQTYEVHIEGRWSAGKWDGYDEMMDNFFLGEFSAVVEARIQGGKNFAACEGKKASISHEWLDGKK